MDEITEILQLIENLRERMHETATQKGISDPDVLAISRMLDDVHNRYLNLLKEINQKTK